MNKLDGYVDWKSERLKPGEYMQKDLGTSRFYICRWVTEQPDNKQYYAMYLVGDEYTDEDGDKQFDHALEWDETFLTLSEAKKALIVERNKVKQ